MRDAARKLDHFESALDVAFGVGDGLAVLGGQELGEAVELLVHEFEELEQDPRASLRVGRGPGRLRRLGIGNGRWQLFAFQAHVWQATLGHPELLNQVSHAGQVHALGHEHGASLARERQQIGLRLGTQLER